jgi:hypothetical protein
VTSSARSIRRFPGGESIDLGAYRPDERRRADAAAVAGELERLACAHPEHAERSQVRAMRLRKRVWEAVA